MKSSVEKGEAVTLGVGVGEDVTDGVSIAG